MNRKVHTNKEHSHILLTKSIGDEGDATVPLGKPGSNMDVDSGPNRRKYFQLLQFLVFIENFVLVGAGAMFPDFMPFCSEEFFRVIKDLL